MKKITMILVCWMAVAPPALAEIRKDSFDKNNDEKIDLIMTLKDGLRVSAEIDRDFDGTFDSWSVYNEKGKLKSTATDTNKDGKPDSFKELIGGDRGLVLKENDANFDGKIDKRSLSQWDPNKSVMTMEGNRPTRIPMPGYKTLWIEQDKDFDGKIDVYKNSLNKDAQDRKGQSIEERPKI